MGRRTISKALLLASRAPLAALLLSLGLAGCASGCSTGYLWQATRGQLALVNRAKPIDEVVQNEKTPPRVKKLLEQIPDIKRFGEKNGLKATKNYTDYVALDRPYVSYIVSACEDLKFKPMQWSFPIVGSVPYLGYFNRQDAFDYAADLRKDGWDVDVRGATAYSTLGYFKDAVLSSMLTSGDDALGDLANVVIHESVHATRYIGGQSFFNESLASFIADELTPVYLKEKLGANAPELRAYVDGEAESKKRGERFQAAYRELVKVYASSEDNEKKRAEKALVFNRLKEDLKISPERQIGNSTMMQFRTYGTGRDEFVKLYQACGSDWKRFWKAINRLTESSFTTSQQEDFSKTVLPLAEGC